MKQAYPETIFPIFPAKRPNGYTEESVIEERMEAFDSLLKFFFKEKLFNIILLTFIWPNVESSMFEVILFKNN